MPTTLRPHIVVIASTIDDDQNYTGRERREIAAVVADPIDDQRDIVQRFGPEEVTANGSDQNGNAPYAATGPERRRRRRRHQVVQEQLRWAAQARGVCAQSHVKIISYRPMHDIAATQSIAQTCAIMATDFPTYGDGNPPISQRIPRAPDESRRGITDRGRGTEAAYLSLETYWPTHFAERLFKRLNRIAQQMSW